MATVGSHVLPKAARRQQMVSAAVEVHVTRRMASVNALGHSTVPLVS